MEDTWSSLPPARRLPAEAHPGRPIRDFWLRLTLSPVFGVLLPTVTGLVTPARHSLGSLLLSYALFTGVAFVIWEGNRRLHYRLSRREDWLRRPWHRVAVLLGTIALFTVPVATGLLLAWRAWFHDPGVTPFALPLTVVGIVSLVAVITNIYETVFVLREWETARIRAAQSEATRLSHALGRLARDIGPHFLFNNLNALQHLLERNDPRAPAFVEALSESYRYLLRTHADPLVPLSAELQALDQQRILASYRYRDLVSTQVTIDADTAAQWQVPPASLSELLINAVKHTRIDEQHPLELRVELAADALTVSNAYRPTTDAVTSTQTGLPNLAERVRLSTGRQATWGVEGDRFVVRVPVVPA